MTAIRGSGDDPPSLRARLRHLLNVALWLRLRWVGAIGPWLLGVAAVLEVPSIGLVTGGGPVNHPEVLAVVGLVVAGSNLALTLRRATVSVAQLVGVLLLDTVLLTAMLASAGSAASPLVSLFLAPVVLAALLVPGMLSWSVFLMTLLGYGALLWGMDGGGHSHHGNAMQAHLVGMFLVHVGAGALVLVGGGRLWQAVAAAESREREATELQARTARLASLATLAAGAAHELATPLSTILVVARELERRAERSDDALALEDAVLVREEVERCQDILQQLSVDAGRGQATAYEDTELAELRADIVGTLACAGHADDATVRVPRRLVAQAARRLVGNAVDATPGGAPPRVDVILQDGVMHVIVEDEGKGMEPAVLARAADPFFTTKAVGAGTGLGLYFAATVARDLGGELSLSSAAGRGTTASLDLPVETT